ncbi:MAG: DUF2723 domain-containing protein [Chloroflexi bacterium]|nr:DUF2723 domain-containing protein [Chloroflexota bacterium]
MLVRVLNKTTAPILIVMVALSLIYRPTFQTIINGSSNLLMIDVGETQAVLNTWGTLHPTSYPLYVILGNLMVTGLKLVGVSAATAPALVSWFWGLLALLLIYILANHLIPKPILAAVIIFLLGLTRFVWVHSVIAEVYSFTFALQGLLLLVALWRQPIRHRILWLAFIGGIGVFHHRTMILLAPALIYATWPDLKPLFRKPSILMLCLLVGLIGFLPYLYLPLQASTHAAWVYGEPNTLSGFWEQFSGKEANHFFGLPESQAAFQHNFDKINDSIVHGVSIPGILLGLLGLAIALRNPNNRRPALTMLLVLIPNYLFAVGLFTDILAPNIIAIELALALGWLFLADAVLSTPIGTRNRQVIWAYYLSIGLQFSLFTVLPIYYSAWLYRHNNNFIHQITHDRTGLATIALAQNTPSGSTLMLAWGPRYYAIGFAQDVEHQLTQIRRADHKADFPTLIQQGPLVTPEYTFYNQSITWWEARLGTPIYLRAVAPYLVQIDIAPRLAESPITLPADFDAPIPVIALDAQLNCTSDYIVLKVDWAAPATPTRDLSIFAHLVDANGSVVANADQAARVYGWHPMTEWLPNEIVTDVYPLPRRTDGVTVAFGLYEQLPSGEFQNYNVQSLPIPCNKKAPGDKSEGQ